MNGKHLKSIGRLRPGCSAITRRLPWIAVVLILCAQMVGPAAAQESTFALQFLGISEETGDVRARAMGVLGLGLDDSRTSIVLNPAALGDLKLMTISAMSVMGARDGESATSSSNRGMARFPHERASMPMFGKFVLTTGFVSLRNFQGDFTLGERQLEGINYEQGFKRQGSLFWFPVGFAGALSPKVRIGGTVDFYLGTVDERWVTEGDSLVSIRTRRRDRMTGHSTTLGLQLLPTSWATAGFTYSSEFTMDRDAKLTLEDIRVFRGTTAIRESNQRRDVQFPQALRVGASVKPAKNILVTSDYLWREWEAYDGRLYGADGLRNESRWGIGAEYRMRDRLAYRVGFSHTNWPQIVGGHELGENTFHFGLGLDITAKGGRVDLGLERAAIGSIEENGREETSWRFLLSISGQELWRRRDATRR